MILTIKIPIYCWLDVSWLSEASCGRNLDDLIQSLGAADLSAAEARLETQSSAGTAETSERVRPKGSEELQDEAATEGEEMKELVPEETDGEMEDEVNDEDEEEEGGEEEDSELMPSLEEYETNIEEVGAEEPASGLRRRNRPEWSDSQRTVALCAMKNCSKYLLRKSISYLSKKY